MASRSAAALALLCVLASSQATTAENTGVCVWPDLDASIIASQEVSIVRVTRTWAGYRPQVPSRFRYKVLDQVSGTGPATATVKTFVADGDDCAPSMIDVEVGDRLVLGFGPEGDTISGPVSAAAFIGRGATASPPHVAAPGLTRTTARHVRAVVESREQVIDTAATGLRSVLAWVARLFRFG